jgi:hypothetical protein
VFTWPFPCSQDLPALEELLTRLAASNPARAEVVKLRLFAGLTMPEASRALGIPLPLTDRDWAFPRTWPQADAPSPAEKPIAP